MFEGPTSGVQRTLGITPPEGDLRPSDMAAQTSSAHIDLEDLLDYGPWTLRQKLIILLAAMTIILDGMDIQMMPFAIPSIAASWHVARSAFANVLALGLVGVMLGTLAGGFLGDRYGRPQRCLSVSRCSLPLPCLPR